MATLAEVVGSFVPLTRNAAEWQGACPFIADGTIAVIGERWLCAAHGCHSEHGDDALGFLRCTGLDEESAKYRLGNGHDWQPSLTAPTPQPSKYAIARLAGTTLTGRVLIVDSRAAARVAEAMLGGQFTALVVWPDGNARWELEPLRGRECLLWPSAANAQAFDRLEAVITDPAGLACTGRIVEGVELSTWTGSRDELVASAKAGRRDLRVSTPASTPLETAQDAPGREQEPPEHEFPPEATETRQPPPRKRRLRIVGGGDVDAAEPDAEALPLELSESGIATQFVMLHRDKFRTVFEWSGRGGPCWMAWDGARWLREPNRVSAMQRAQVLASQVKQWPAAAAVAVASRVRFESRKFIGSFLDLAAFSPELVAHPEAFDADKMLLNTPGGTVDLATGKLCEHDINQYLTRCTAVTPAPGKHPLFDNVIERMCAGDDSMRGYIWRCLGYSLTADQREEVFWFLHGKPQSGKSTLIKAIAEILGNSEEGGYAATFDMELFTEQRNDRGSERLAHLYGARFAWASETEEGKHFKTALLKLATGGDKLSGRFLYQERFSFEPTHHLWIFGNERIHLKSSDAGIKRRIHMIEYPGIISEDERDNTLKDRLRDEYPAILHSMIQGCLDWQVCGGLGKPERISDAVEDYMEGEDEISAWMDECAERAGPTVRVANSEAFRSFTAWAEKNGAYAISAKRFIGEMDKRGFGRAKSNGVRYIVGLTLKLGAGLP